MDLSNLHPSLGATSSRYRKGRGHASGNGKTSGKGHKGQKARSGAPRIGFEGGQMPIYRRLPKRGFKNINTREVATVNVGDLNDRFEDGSDVKIVDLLEKGLIKKTLDSVKVLGNGKLEKKLNVEANSFSSSAKEKIEALGGKAEVI